MNLRTRLVLALTALLAVGMVVYGLGTYRAFARAELQRLDEDLRQALPLVTRELVAAARDRGGPDDPGPDHHGGPGDPGRGRDGFGPVIVAPGTFGQLVGPSGRVLATIQVAEGAERPDLSSVELDATDIITVPSEDGSGSWRVSTTSLSGASIIVAVPTTSVAEALRRLLVIEVVAGVVLLVLLAGGAWVVLRSGLRPLERMADTARSINAGSLGQRVQMPREGTEVGELAAALNGMLDDLERSFQQREATEAKLRRFLADAAHELRTPLTSIQGFAELFRLGPDNEHVDLPTIMRRIEEESGRMRRLVDDLLVLARLDETHQVERRPVDLAVLAADACSDAVAMQPDRPVRLDAPEPVPVLGDPGHLRQAVGNLVVNALTHTPAGAPIEVSARREHGHARLTVRDHGPGLDVEALERVFDRFWQADPSRAGTGTGLGLSIVQAVVQEHGGRAAAANAVDGGAVFTIDLPPEPGT